MTCGFKHDIRNLVNFHPTTQKSTNFFFDGLFLSKVHEIWAKKKKNAGVIFYDTEQWCKIWTNPDLVVSKNSMRNRWTFIKALKSLKSCRLIGSFCPKHIIFELENFRGNMCHITEKWCKV